MERSANHSRQVKRVILHSASQEQAEPERRIDPLAVETLKTAYVRTYKMLLESTGRSDRYIRTQTKSRPDDDRREGPQRLNVWEKIVRVLTLRQLNITGYVYYAMTTLWNTYHEIYPNMLLSRQLLEEYQAGRALLDEQDRFRWCSEQTQFKSECWKIRDYGEMTEQQQRQFALLSRNLQLSPLFRFLHAWLNGLPDLCEQSRQRAALQYGTNPCLYDEFLEQEGVNPARFRDVLLRISRLEGGQ